MIETILGIAATVAFALYAIPQTWAVLRAPRLQGYSLAGWIALAAATTAVLVQLVLAHAWITVVAQVLNTASVYYVLQAIWRKS